MIIIATKALIVAMDTGIIIPIITQKNHIQAAGILRIIGKNVKRKI
jgi:hypothetical protein